MSNRCNILKNKKPRSGHSVSHSNIKTKRRFCVNTHIASFYSDALKKTFRLNVSTCFLRTVAKSGGFDEYFSSLSAKCGKLTNLGLSIRNQIRKQIGIVFVVKKRYNKISKA